MCWHDGMACCAHVVTVVMSLLLNCCVVCCHCAIAVEKARELERGERGR